MQNKDKPLTAKQARFAEEYVVDLNATAAAKRAGYSAKSAAFTGPRLALKPHVAAKISVMMDARSKAVAIDAKWVLRELKRLYERCMADIRPALDRKGKQRTDPETGEPLFVFNSASAARSLELIGKHVDVAAFEERVKVGVDDDLAAAIRRGHKRAGIGHAKVIDAEYEEVDPREVDPIEQGNRRAGRPKGTTGTFPALTGTRTVTKGN